MTKLTTPTMATGALTAGGPKNPKSPQSPVSPHSPTRPAKVIFTLNGREVSVRADHPHLLAALREELDVTSPKDGCSPTGQCGCCTVMLDDKAQVACQIPLAKAEGRMVTTLEGVDEGERRRYARAFAACGGLQCGFCIPGIVMRAKAQVDKKGSSLAREDMARHLGAHLCRCTGYVKNPRRHRQGGRRRGPRAASPGRCRQPRDQVPGRGTGARRPRLYRRPPPAGPPARGPPADRPRPGRRRQDRHRQGRRSTRRGRRHHRRRHPGRPSGRHHPSGLAHHGAGRRPYLLRRRRAGRGGGRDAPSGQGGGGAGRRDLRATGAADQPTDRHGVGGGGRMGDRRQRALSLGLRPGRRGHRLGRQRPRGQRGVRDAESRARFPRT